MCALVFSVSISRSFPSGYQMGKLIEGAVGPVRTDSLGRCLRRRTYYRMVCSRRLYWRRISDYLRDGFVALAGLGGCTPAMAAWLHSRCFIAGDSDRNDDVAAIRAAYRHRTSGPVNGGSRRACFTEVLFYLSVYPSFPDGLSIFEHHGRCPEITSRPRFCTGGASHKSSDGK